MNFIKKVLYNLPSFILRKKIIFESSPDFSDNTYAVYKNIRNREKFKKYKLIWFVSNNYNNSFSNVKTIKMSKNIFNKIRRFYHRSTSKIIIDCNRFQKKINKHQLRVHLTHGAFIKLPIDYCKNCGETDILIQLSETFTDINSKLFKVPKNRIYTTGYPRNDIIINNDKIPDILKEFNNKKFIIWMPTYRNHKNSTNSIYNMNIKFKYGVPCINTKQELLNLNKELKKLNIILFLKLHPAESTKELEKIKCSNIIMLNQSENIYCYLKYVDGLITDYSSIYYDFLLANKPIGLAVPDFDEYKKHVELFPKDFNKEIPGYSILNSNDLISFINDIANNKDINNKKRTQALKKYHKYYDSYSSDRVVDLIEKEMK